jgi:putative Mn2+ efflux pump MntP
MSFIEIMLIAVSLAMDAFAVSLASGVTLKKCCVRHALRIALSHSNHGLLNIIAERGE